ncbi:MAG: hypothetical protein V4736_11575 [Bdellovibrionota bacterium]
MKTILKSIVLTLLVTQSAHAVAVRTIAVAVAPGVSGDASVAAKPVGNLQDPISTAPLVPKTNAAAPVVNPPVAPKPAAPTVVTPAPEPITVPVAVPAQPLPILVSKTLTPAATPLSRYRRLVTQVPSVARSMVDQVVDSFNSRFDNTGRLMSGDPRKGAFINTQESNIAILKKQNSLIPQFSIKNNLVPNLDASIYLIVDEKNTPLAFLFEYKKPDDYNRAQLRVRPVHHLYVNNTIQEIEGQPSIALSSQVHNLQAGGDINIICLTDMKKRRYSTFTVRLTQVQGRWVVSYANTPIAKVQLTLWFDIFSKNGGIKSVMVNGNQGVALKPF